MTDRYHATTILEALVGEPIHTLDRGLAEGAPAAGQSLTRNDVRPQRGQRPAHDQIECGSSRFADSWTAEGVATA